MNKVDKTNFSLLRNTISSIAFCALITLLAIKVHAERVGLRFPPEENGIRLSSAFILIKKDNAKMNNWDVGGVRINQESFFLVQHNKKIIINWNPLLLQPQYVLKFSSAQKKPQVMEWQKLINSISQSQYVLSENENLEKICFVQEGQQEKRALCFDPKLSLEKELSLNDQKITDSTSYKLNTKINKLQYSNDRLVYTTTIQAPEIELSEVTSKFIEEENQSLEYLQVLAYGPEPVGRVRKLNVQQNKWLEKTIGDLRNKIGFEILRSAPFFNLQTEFGWLISHNIEADSYPRSQDRLYFKKNPPQSFASSSLDLQIELPVESQVDNDLNYQISSQELKYENGVWSFSLPQKNSLNRSRLSAVSAVQNQNADKERKYIFDYEIYRGHSLYLTAALGLASQNTGGFSGLSEFKLDYWPSELWGDHYWLSQRRWGFTFDHAQTGLINTSKINVEEYKIRELMISYRLTPGLSNWDESVLLQSSLIEWEYSGVRNSQFLALGAKWSRSLPKFFEPVFSFLPFFRNPKWAEISYRYSAWPRVPDQEGNTWVLQGLGRIEIKSSFYFEGGWSINRIDIRDTRNKKALDYTAARGYLGLGYRF
jgi:hypothetical protein